MRKQTKVWTTRDGTKIRVCDMSDEHLVNAMNMLERYAQSEKNKTDLLALDMEAHTHGDMATYLAEQAVAEAIAISWESFLLEIYWNMKDDLERRGINGNNKVQEA